MTGQETKLTTDKSKSNAIILGSFIATSCITVGWYINRNGDELPIQIGATGLAIIITIATAAGWIAQNDK